MNERTRFHVLTILGVLIVALVTFGITFAYLGPVVGEGAKTNINVESCANISFSDNRNSVNLENTFPMSDIIGMQSSPYSFKITSNCGNTSGFKLYLVTVSGNTINDNAVKYAITQKGSKTIVKSGVLGVETDVTSSFNTKDRQELKIGLDNKDFSKIYQISNIALNANESKEYDLYLWIDSSVEAASTMNKTFEVGVAIKDN